MHEDAGRQVGQLSGGQRQRVLLARALVQEADLLLLDEPLSGADAPTEAAFSDILGRLRAEGRTVVVSSHDLAWASARCDLVCLLAGRVVAFGPPAEALDPRLPRGGLRRPGRRRRRRARARARGTPRPLMLHYLTDPLQFTFMQRALVAVVLTGYGVRGAREATSSSAAWPSSATR